MLRLSHVHKEYPLGDNTVRALRDVSLSFRKNEFVAVLGASGCGKTTLLNLIGGLDRYTEGDLFIEGKSTKDFTDKDWDSYRNHAVGFVFQSYNLITPQTILQNVELALTLSGVGKAERRRRAEEALKQVGLGDQLKKKPNQLSGGQMQRVAIARALVNDPEIILADEPTGALDSATSVQIMDILKEIAAHKLIIMVTHNPELAEQYATRIIRLHDGQVEGDSLPYTEEEEKRETAEKQKKTKHPSMSFATAFSLSMHNLLTKKTRTFLTSFAGSIGIIGIALILSLSNGIQLYINRVQEDALSSAPLTIEAETFDMSALMETMMGTNGGGDHDLDAVYSNPVLMQMMQAMNNGIKQNNLKEFKVFLENGENGFASLTTDIQYNYDVPLNIYKADTSEGVMQVNPSTFLEQMYESMGVTGAGGMSSLATEMYNLDVWDEMLGDADLIASQYDVVTGKIPSAYNEIALVVDKNNEISDMTLYTLGLISSEDFTKLLNQFMTTAATGTKTEVSEDAVRQRFEYADLMGLSYKILLPTDYYEKNEDGVWEDKRTDTAFMKAAVNNGTELSVVGILRPNEQAAATSISGSVVYTSALTQYIMEQTNQSALVADQLANKEIDVLTGGRFGTLETYVPTKDDVLRYTETLPEAERAETKLTLMLTGFMPYDAETAEASLAILSEENRAFYALALHLSGKRTDASLAAQIEQMPDESKMQLNTFVLMMGQMTDETVIENLRGEEDFIAFLTNEGKVSSGTTLESNLRLLGYTSEDSPSSINIYAKDFRSKETIVEKIEAYNASRAEEDRISYTDLIGYVFSAMSTIVNFVTYALIAFVSISLVVSSIMIGIITYISVLERTKEIGILRAIGASKKDIARVFNAETFIVGLIAGILGILVTLVLILPLNAIIYALGEVENIAKLPLIGAVILIAVSVLLTLIAGLIPSRIAARKDPVESLRSE